MSLHLQSKRLRPTEALRVKWDFSHFLVIHYLSLSLLCVCLWLEKWGEKRSLKFLVFPSGKTNESKNFQGIIFPCVKPGEMFRFSGELLLFWRVKPSRGKKMENFIFTQFHAWKKKYCSDNIWIRLPPVHFVRISACFLKAKRIRTNGPEPDWLIWLWAAPSSGCIA